MNRGSPPSNKIELNIVLCSNNLFGSSRNRERAYLHGALLPSGTGCPAILRVPHGLPAPCVSARPGVLDEAGRAVIRGFSAGRSRRYGRVRGEPVLRAQLVSDYRTVAARERPDRPARCGPLFPPA